MSGSQLIYRNLQMASMGSLLLVGGSALLYLYSRDFELVGWYHSLVGSASYTHLTLPTTPYVYCLVFVVTFH